MKFLLIAAIDALSVAPVQARSLTAGTICLEHPMTQHTPPRAPVLTDLVGDA